jgi:hypothetical protein
MIKPAAVSLLLALSLASYGEGISYLKLSFKTSDPVYYLVSGKPTLTFDDSHLIVTAGDASENYARTDLDSFEFVGEATGLSQLDAGAVKCAVSGNSVVITGTDAASASLLDLNGRTMKRALRSDDAIAVDLSDLAAGIYVVALPDGHSFKVLKQ